MSLEDTDREAAKHAVADRVSLQDIQNAMGEIEYCRLSDATGNDHHDTMTLCVITMLNGFVVIGKSAPASKENFNKEYGEKRAYEDAVRQIWPLMAFALLNRKFT